MSERIAFYYDDYEHGTYFYGTPSGESLVEGLRITPAQAQALERAIEGRVDAFIRDELPGLLAEATRLYGDYFDGWQPEEDGVKIAEKIAVIHAVMMTDSE